MDENDRRCEEDDQYEEEEEHARGKGAASYDEFEARKELMRQMKLTRPPGKKKSNLKEQVGGGGKGGRKTDGDDDGDEEETLLEEGEKDISAALLPQSPLLFFSSSSSSSNGKAMENSKAVEHAFESDAASNIQHFARVKQLSKATQTFKNLVENQRINPSVYTYCALLNAYANAGRTKDIEIILRRMASETKHKEEEKGKEDAILRPDCKPNVVAFTMLLKSYLIECDVRAAVKLVESMAMASTTSKVGSEDGEDDISQCACGVGIDSRALNTFFRVCLRTGDVSSAIQWTGTNVEDVLDDTSKLLLAKIYARSRFVGIC